MTMKELKKRIEAIVEEQNDLYKFYLKMWDEAISKEDIDYYDGRLLEVGREIKTYRNVLDMMEENKK